jgi:hypothetical protein
MIRSAKDLRKCEVVATDGRVGSVDDFYFDGERWAIRHVVIDTGSRVKGRRVLISPLAVSRAAWDEGQLLLSISRDQVNSSPDIDSHLRSASKVRGYVIRATDGDLGHVEDFLFDDLNWAVRYLVVDTSTWCFGRHVLVAPRWIRQIAWADRSVMANVRRQRLKNAPEYDRAEHVDRPWEASYYRHLQKPGYWLDEEDARAIKAVQSYLRDEPNRHAPGVERRSRPR